MKPWDNQHSSGKQASAFVCHWLSLSAASLSLSQNSLETRAHLKCVTLCPVWVSNCYPSTKKAIFSLLKTWTQFKLKSIRTVKFCSIFRNSKLVLTVHYLAVSFKVKMICVSTKPSWPTQLSQRRSTETRKPDSYFLKTATMKSIPKLSHAITTKLSWWKFQRLRLSGSFYANWWLHWSTCCSQWTWCSLLPTTSKLRLLLNSGTTNGKPRCNWWL